MAHNGTRKQLPVQYRNALFLDALSQGGRAPSMVNHDSFTVVFQRHDIMSWPRWALSWFYVMILSAALLSPWPKLGFGYNGMGR